MRPTSIQHTIASANAVRSRVLKNALLVFVVAGFLTSGTGAMASSDLNSAMAASGYCDGTQSVAATSLSSQYDFFTNYGEYMPRAHCLRSADGTPDWPWIIGLIALNLVVVAGYVKIVIFWLRCYFAEQVGDRDRKLMDLAGIFVLCAVCGYGLSIVIFFWPVYRLLAIALAALAVITWHFAADLEPFGRSFTARRLQRQLNESLQNENDTLEAKNAELRIAHEQITETASELKRSNDELDEFAYAASHDLKAPLRAIDSLAAFVVEDLTDAIPENSLDDLQLIQQRVKRMERMLDGMLTYSRLRKQRFAFETFSLSDAVEGVTELLDIPARFNVQTQNLDVVLTAPRSPLEQVIRNLVDNAVKHHESDSGVIVIRAADAGDMIQVSVSDDGVGIDPQYHEQVFQLF
jgi:signal transduction histidine kinase